MCYRKYCEKNKNAKWKYLLFTKYPVLDVHKNVNYFDIENSECNSKKSLKIM